ncbi:N-MYC downregulated-like 1 [Actinidia rufa]|uniref:N-MYC downregulated-like 1 n=1 Tax=Actinidia rufa TaxID=165716 RepID=A0A7J0E1B4_9ERIC|nr:N-MYC downregulated-like 1 [Actinidia rufa]
MLSSAALPTLALTLELAPATTGSHLLQFQHLVPVAFSLSLSPPPRFLHNTKSDRGQNGFSRKGPGDAGD